MSPSEVLSDRIVVGVDGSAASVTALRWAISEAAGTGATVHAVMSWRPEPLTAPPAPPVAPLTVLRQERVKQLRQTISNARDGHRDVRVEAEVVEGKAAPNLVDVSRDARMLVVGSRGYGRFRGALLGSVSTGCVRQAQCPVVVIPHPMVDQDVEAAADAARAT